MVPRDEDSRSPCPTACLSAAQTNGARRVFPTDAPSSRSLQRTASKHEPRRRSSGGVQLGRDGRTDRAPLDKRFGDAA